MSADNSLVPFLGRCRGLVQRIQQSCIENYYEVPNFSVSERFTSGLGSAMGAKQELIDLVNIA
jgi:hypothetical protein